MNRFSLRLALLTLALAFHAPPARAQDVPAIEHPVNDLAHVLSTSDADAIASRIEAHRTASGVQIAVLLVPSTNGQPIEDYSIAVAERWRGGSHARDDGVLITFAIRDHRSRIELGTGLEDRITDGQARTMLDSVRPQLRASDFAGAIGTVVNDVIGRTLATGESPPTDNAVPAPPAPDPSTVAIPPLVPPNPPADNVPYQPPPPIPTATTDGSMVTFFCAFFVIGVVALIFILAAVIRNKPSRSFGGGGVGFTSTSSTSDSSWWSSSSSSSSYDSSWSSSSASSSFDTSSSSSVSTFDSSSNSSSWSGGGGDFGGGGASSGW